MDAEGIIRLREQGPESAAPLSPDSPLQKILAEVSMRITVANSLFTYIGGASEYKLAEIVDEFERFYGLTRSHRYPHATRAELQHFALSIREILASETLVFKQSAFAQGLIVLLDELELRVGQHRQYHSTLHEHLLLMSRLINQSGKYVQGGLNPLIEAQWELMESNSSEKLDNYRDVAFALQRWYLSENAEAEGLRAELKKAEAALESSFLLEILNS